MIRNFEDGDIVTSGDNQFLLGKKETANGVRHRLLMFLGEYFLDISDGTPWFQSILGKVPQGVAEINLKQRILTAPGVVAISEFNFETDRNERSISVDCSVVDVNNEQVKLIIDEELF